MKSGIVYLLYPISPASSKNASKLSKYLISAFKKKYSNGYLHKKK